MIQSLTAFTALLCLIASPSKAEGTNEVFLHTTFLAASTDWCPADAGIPVVVEMDGPDIIKGPSDWPTTVRERSAGRIRNIHNGERTRSHWHEEKVDYTHIGRFSVEFQFCHNMWDYAHVTGTWRLSANDGSEMHSGILEDDTFPGFHIPFFSPVAGQSKVQYAKFGEQRFFTPSVPQIRKTQRFLAEPNKE